MYIQSVSGQVYKVDAMPMFSAGYTVVGRKEYEEFYAKFGEKPDEKMIKFYD